MPVNKGDILIIPAPTEANKEGRRVTVHWQQSLMSRSADYYVLVCRNKTQGNAEVPLFLQAEWYADANLAGAGSRNSEGNFEFTVDARHQFGQKNAAGEKRFFVWHDKERKPYQHRFLETAFGSLAANTVTELAGAFGQAQQAEMVKSILQGFVGDYLLNV